MKIVLRGDSVVSDMNIVVPRPVNYAGGPFWDPYSFGIRSIQTVDLNADGYRDIFISPSYARYNAVGLHPIVLLNDGSGGFTDGTDKLFPSMKPTIGSPNGVFIGHFTQDGRLGMFIVDQGLELQKADGTPDWDNGWKAKNQFWLQDENGVFQDKSHLIDVNVPSFNHVSTAGDVNGDGNLDVIMTRLGGPTVEGSGTFFYLGDGKGGFAFSTKGLPDEVRYMANAERNWSGAVDYQFSGTNAIGDLSNSGRQDLITASYTGKDQVSGITIRIYKQDQNGQFDKVFHIDQPESIKAFGISGASGIVTGDIDGDGLRDIVIHWEGAASTLQVLRNKGNYQFEDATREVLGNHQPRLANTRDETGEWVQHAGMIALEDVNHDGRPDLVLRQMASSATQLVQGAPGGAFIYLNEGGKLSPAQFSIAGAQTTAEQFTRLTKIADHQTGIPLQFDTTNSGRTDYVFISTGLGLDQTKTPAQPTSLHVSTLFGADTGAIYTARDIGDTLIGRNVASTFYGSHGNDTMLGGSANDVFHGSAGRDAINGGDGLDVLRLSSPSSAHEITRTPQGFTMTSGHAAANLTGVERIAFADQSIALDIDGNGGQAYRIYQAAFARVPDLAGLGYWIGAMDGGASLKSVAEGFVVSSEFKELYGANPSSSDIVSMFYQNVLRRPGEKAGIDYWAGILDSKAGTVADVLMGFSESAENQAALVGVMSNGFAYIPYQ